MRSSLPWKREPNVAKSICRREQPGAVGRDAAFAVEAGVGATDDEPGHELGARVGDLGVLGDRLPQRIVRSRTRTRSGRCAGAR